MSEAARVVCACPSTLAKGVEGPSVPVQSYLSGRSPLLPVCMCSILTLADGLQRYLGVTSSPGFTHFYQIDISERALAARVSPYR